MDADVGRIGDAMARPGMDTRRWVLSCVVDGDPEAVDISADGVWLDCSVIQTGEPLRAQWPMLLQPGSSGGGVWVPPPRPGDLVDVVVDAAAGAMVGTALPTLPRLDAGSERKLPDQVLAEPNAVHVVGASERVYVRGSEVVLGTDDASTAKQVARKGDLAKLLSGLTFTVDLTGTWPGPGLATVEMAAMLKADSNDRVEITEGSSVVKAGD